MEGATVGQNGQQRGVKGARKLKPLAIRLISFRRFFSVLRREICKSRLPVKIFSFPSSVDEGLDF